MPNNAYRSLKWSKRVKDYPFTHSVALAMLANCVAMALTAGLAPIGQGFGLTLILFAVPASLLILVGLQWRGSVFVGYGIERAGHILAVGAWLIDMYILFSLGAIAALSTPLILICAHSLRGYRLWKQGRAIKEILEEAAESVGDDE